MGVSFIRVDKQVWRVANLNAESLRQEMSKEIFHLIESTPKIGEINS